MDRPGVAIPRTEQWDMNSTARNRKYRIFVARPEEEAPAAGFPVLYVLDANAVFATLVETLRVQSRRPDKTGVVPAIVVGIGYPTDAPFAPDRFYDFTLPRSVEEAPFLWKGQEPPEQGGAEYFLHFIERDLKPVIERDYPIDTAKQAIVGHSLGGLFVLQVLLTKPSAFQKYIAGSPSIHWNRRFLFEEQAHLAARLEAAKASVGVMIAVGGLETSHRMIENAKAFAERLAACASSGIEVQFQRFEDEGHVSLLPALMSRSVRFASRRETG